MQRLGLPTSSSQKLDSLGREDFQPRCSPSARPPSLLVLSHLPPPPGTFSSHLVCTFPAACSPPCPGAQGRLPLSRLWEARHCCLREVKGLSCKGSPAQQRRESPSPHQGRSPHPPAAEFPLAAGQPSAAQTSAFQGLQRSGGSMPGRRPPSSPPPRPGFLAYVETQLQHSAFL